MVRVGTVSSINYKAGMVSVVFEDKDDMVTDDLPMLSYEYEMPEVGDKVICLFFGNSISTGICLGRYFFDGNKPVEHGKNIYFKHFLKRRENTFMRYDSNTDTITFKVSNLVIDGNLTVTGNVQVNGSINAKGDIIDGGSNTPHHSH
jgi:phage baseplate assembly protein gpV